MAFIRRRVTERGTTSTTLVEAYRDEEGRPRQRVLANLYGTDSTLAALAKLAAQRELLRKEKGKLDPEVEELEKVYSTVMANVQSGHRYAPTERRKIDRLKRERKRRMQRIEVVNADLQRVQRDGSVIRKHCDASEDEIQAAIRSYKKELQEAEAGVLMGELMRRKAKHTLRGLSLTRAAPVDDGLLAFAEDILE